MQKRLMYFKIELYLNVDQFAKIWINLSLFAVCYMRYKQIQVIKKNIISRN